MNFPRFTLCLMASVALLAASAQTKVPAGSPADLAMKEANYCMFVPKELTLNDYQRKNKGTEILLPDFEAAADQNGVLPTRVETVARLKAIVENRMVHYYELAERYDTPQKMQKFMASAEYQELNARFRTLRRNFMSQRFYIVSPSVPSYAGGTRTYTARFGTVKGNKRKLSVDVILHNNKAVQTDGNFQLNADGIAEKIGAAQGAVASALFFMFAEDQEASCLVAVPLRIIVYEVQSGEILAVQDYAAEAATVLTPEQLNPPKAEQ